MAGNCLNSWHTELGMVVMVEQEFFTTALATEHPNLRAEVREGGGREGGGGEEGGGEGREGGIEGEKRERENCGSTH